MPPKRRTDDFEPLYDEEVDLVGSYGAGESKRRKRIQNSAILHVGPKFRDEHVTLFRATNQSVIAAEENKTQQLFDYIVDDISAGTVRAYDSCDIMLQDYIHPNSPKMISRLLRDLSLDGDTSMINANIPVPLYLCLTAGQMANIVSQYGISADPKLFMEDASADRYPLQLIPCNRNSGYKYRDASVAPNKLENFVNEIVGRMNRMTTTNDGSWDKKEKYFQKIDFKFRVAPRNSVSLNALELVSRGKGDNNKITMREKTELEDSDEVGRYASQGDQFERAIANAAVKTDRDMQLEKIGEDGESQAAMLEWKFQLTTHTLLSPQMHSAFMQAGTQIGESFPDHASINSFLSDPHKRSHLANLIEYELLEGETSLRIYTDARAQERATQKKIYSIFCLKNAKR